MNRGTGEVNVYLCGSCQHFLALILLGTIHMFLLLSLKSPALPQKSRPKCTPELVMSSAEDERS